MILRNVSKAFDKIWHTGLQYKIILLNFPDIITKFLNNSIQNRKAKIRINGTSFPLHTGVPQGSATSPTVYTLYTTDISQPAHGFINLQCANMTQIIHTRVNQDNSWLVELQ